MSNFIRGTCEKFCPEREAKLRIKEKLLHFYELKSDKKYEPDLLVKEFSRSAAGTKAPRAEDLRTERCLQQTIYYLIKKILLDRQKPFHVTYDFIFDRLRAVRQEIVMQNFDKSQTLKLIEPMIMFLAYSRYRLCGETCDIFDEKICDQHLQECLKRVLCCYDEFPTDSLKFPELKNREFIESLYQLFNLGSIEALNRGILLPKYIRNGDTFSLSFSIAMHYHRGNLYRVMEGIRRLPHILCAVSSLKLQTIRQKLLLQFAHAYNNKYGFVPADFLCRVAIFEDVGDLFTTCEHYGLKVRHNAGSVHFQKTDFQSSVVKEKPKHEPFVANKLKDIILPEVLLLQKL